MLLNSLDPRAFAENDALALRYASFVQHAWNPAIGRFRNFMGYDRHWLEVGGSEDSNGRALWALGHCAGRAPLSGLAAWGLEWFGRTAAIAGDFQSPRDRKSTRLNSSHSCASRMPSSACTKQNTA